MLERRTQAIKDRLDGLPGLSRSRRTNSREARREPRVNFNEHPKRGSAYGSTRGRGNSYSNVTGNNRARNPTNIRGDSIGSTQIWNEQPRRDTIRVESLIPRKGITRFQGRAQPSE